MDLLRLGPDVEVLGPASLRREVVKRLREANAIYALAGAGPGAVPPGDGPVARGGNDSRLSKELAAVAEDELSPFLKLNDV